MLARQVNSKTPSTGENLLKMIYDIASGLKNLQGLSKNRDSGLLQLDRVYYDDESNAYRVFENITNIKIFDFYFNLLVRNSSFSIFSPSTIAKKPLISKNFDLSKIDSFNLGMIVLCFGINERPNLFYKKDRNFNLPLLNVKKSLFAEKYMAFPLLCDQLEDLLQIKLKDRLSLSQLLKKYPKNTNLEEYQRSSIQFGSKKSFNINQSHTQSHSQSHTRSHTRSHVQTPNQNHIQNHTQNHTQRKPSISKSLFVNSKLRYI